MLFEVPGSGGEVVHVGGREQERWLKALKELERMEGQRGALCSPGRAPWNWGREIGGSVEGPAEAGGH